jgi:nucleotide-binding universal stress UspA family protein
MLIAADFSEQSRRAFRVACSLAGETKSRLFVLHVVEKIDAIDHAVSPSPAREGAWVYDDDVKEQLSEFYAPTHSVDVKYLVKEGGKAEVILRTAREVGADMIALGTHGRTGLGRLLAGSVAEAVLRRARCPVLALSSWVYPESEPMGVVLHPTDFSERSEASLRVARTLARDLGARLILLHVMPVEVVVYGTIPVPLDVPAVRDSLESLAKTVDGPDLKYPVVTRLAQGNFATEILRVAGEVGCGMIVLGTHGRSGLGRLLMGSVAEAVLRGSKCSVLTVKAAFPAVATLPTPESARV